jgi:hypothetical protein
MHTLTTKSRSATIFGFFIEITIAEGIDDLDVLDVRHSILGVVEMFHIVLKVFIMFWLDGCWCFLATK